MIKVYDVLEVSRAWQNAIYHAHTHDEINFILSGHGKYIVKDVEYDVKAGDVFLFLQNTVHQLIWVDDAEEMRLIKVHFAPEDLISQSEHDLYLHLVKVFYQSGIGVRIPGETDAAEQLVALAKVLLELENANISSTLAKPYMLSSLTAVFCNYFGKEINEERGKSNLKNYDSVFAAAREINLHYREDLDLDSLAKTAGMSKNSFLTHFKNYFGVTPYHYILVKRMEAAVRMLAENKLSITEIAFACGFHSTAAFNRQFLKMTGMTPTEMQKQL